MPIRIVGSGTSTSVGLLSGLWARLAGAPTAKAEILHCFFFFSNCKISIRAWLMSIFRMLLAGSHPVLGGRLACEREVTLLPTVSAGSAERG